MKRIQVLLISFFDCLPFATAVSLPLQLIAGNDLSNISANPSNVTAPTPPAPPGFTIEQKWNTSEPLNPVAVYTSAIELMYQLTGQPWDREPNIDVIEFTHLPGVQLFILVKEFFLSALRIQTYQIVMTLYQAIVDMAQKRPGFYSIKAWPKLQGHSLGEVMISAIPLASRVDDTSINNITTDPIAGVGSAVDAILVLGSSVTIVDRADSRFKILIEYDGRNVPVQEMFTAILDGLATGAQYNADDPCSYITGVSASGNTAFHIGQMYGQNLFCSQIERAFYVISSFLFKDKSRDKRFEEMSVSVEFAGKKIADGYVLRLGKVEQRTRQVRDDMNTA